MFNKIPTAWLQLRYQKVRLLVALSGVIFAVVIIFMQLGIRDALFDSALRFHYALDGDCFLISRRSSSLISMDSFTIRRLYQALAFSEVDFVNPIYLDFGRWKNPQTNNNWLKIFVIGFDIRNQIFNLPGVAENLDKLKIPDLVLFDRSSRSDFGDIVTGVEKQGEIVVEVGDGRSNRTIQVTGLFQLGTSFGSDGNLLTSHLNFLRIFPKRDRDLIELGLIKLKPGANADDFARKLQEYLPQDIRVFSQQKFIEFEKHYWQTSTAIGFVFGLGVCLGFIVGIVVVYQILYTNVAEHLPEYATLKAIGYRHRYLLYIVLQQALLIALLGYIPGFIFSYFQYQLMHQATLLPIAMNWPRAIFVLGSTIGMCFIAGATAVNKLKAADPADIF